MLLLQLVLYCGLYFLVVKLAAKDSGRNCLYFYSEAYQTEAEKRGIARKEDTAQKRKRFMTAFFLVMLAALLLILCVWNRVTDFKTAYWQTALFLVVMNWFDGIVIDMLWVGRSKIWRIQGMEGVPYTWTWAGMCKKRIGYTVMYLVIAVVVAGLVVLLGKL